jgi:hypothetical protein
VTTAVPSYLTDAFGHLSPTGRAAFASTVMDVVATRCDGP